MGEQTLINTLPTSLIAEGCPYVTIIMPIRNEAAYIQRSLDAVLSQDYPASYMEVIVVDGMSTDNTKDIVRTIQAQHPNLLLMDNLEKIVPTGLNAALKIARGEIIIRVDGHSEIAPDYVTSCVEKLRKEGVDCVGGPIYTVGESFVAKTIALAMSSSFGVGDSAFRTVKDRAMFVDTVPYPAYTREAIIKVGTFDIELVRNQDDEYNYRLRKLGGKILLSPDIHSRYYSRSSIKSLYRQYYQYGFWKVRVMQKHPQQMSLRQFVPPLFVLALLFPMLAALIYPPILAFLMLVLELYFIANLAASAWVASQNGWQFLPLLPVVYMVLHVSYGVGFMVGLVKFANRWKIGRIPDVSWAGSAVKTFFRRRLSIFKALPSIGVLLDNAIRRMMDVSIALLGLILLSPIFLLLTILIRREARGSVIYRGLRVGKNGVNFHILKFRTMYVSAESNVGPRVTAQDDPRITPLGRILRESKLNELPQLWNVLVGEMSLVGPRPEDPQIVARWPEEVRQEVLSVSPGITSPASVVYRNEESLLQSRNVMGKYLRDILPSKLRFDQLYVRNRSILTDMDVLFWTFILLLPQLKRLSIPEHLLYWGPLTRFIKWYLTWFLIDIVIAFGAIGTAGVIWRLGAPLDLGIEKAIRIALLIAVLFSLINSLMGLNHIHWKQSRTLDVMDLALSNGAVTILLFVLNLFWPTGPPLPPSMVVVAGTFAFIGFAATRYRSRLINDLLLRRMQFARRGMSALSERLLIVGSGELGQTAVRLIHSSDLAQAFVIVGMVDDDPRKIGLQINGCKVIGNTQSIPTLAKKYDIGLILFALPQSEPEEQTRILSLCQTTPARIMMMPEILDLLHALFPRDRTEREQLVNKAIFSATIDRSTGMYNRQHFIDLAERELPRVHRYGRPLSIVLLSLAHLRLEDANDAPIVDQQFLKTVADHCRKNIREVDISGRYDVHEFVFALPETDLTGAKIMADRLKRYLMETPIHLGRSSHKITVKAGVATAAQDTPDIETLLTFARTGMDVI